MEQEERLRRAMARLLAAGRSGAHGVLTQVDGLRLHHLEAGSGVPTIVLLHGGTGGGANWFRMLGPLARRYRVLAPDLPGFGLSQSALLEPPLGWTTARLLRGWLAAVRARDVLVVGTSFGGLAALRLAQLSPDRVTRLLLLSSAGLGRRLPLAVRLATLPLLTRAGVRPSRRGTAAVFRTMLTSDRSELTRREVEPLLDYLHASAKIAGTAYLARTLRLFAGPRGQREIVTPAEFAALRIPISFVWGERDPFLPLSHARRAACHCRDARVSVLDGVGHSPNWERPAEVIAAVDELAARPAPRG
jgi:pimeloyl-ACP methyl ester carboxylesterase